MYITKVTCYSFSPLQLLVKYDLMHNLLFIYLEKNDMIYNKIFLFFGC